MFNTVYTNPHDITRPPFDQFWCYMELGLSNTKHCPIAVEYINPQSFCLIISIQVVHVTLLTWKCNIDIVQ